MRASTLKESTLPLRCAARKFLGSRPSSGCDFRAEGRQFDLIVLDPPKFAASAQQVDRAARAYKEINLVGMQLLRPGGLLFTYSCSGAIDADLFQKIVAGAAADAKVTARIQRRLAGGVDHPLLTSFPEGEYLKGLLLQVG